MRLSPKPDTQNGVYRSAIFHPLALLGTWLIVGFLFALQEYASVRFSPNPMKFRSVMTLWSIYTLISGGAFVAVWIPLRETILNARWGALLKIMLPLSLVLSIAEEMLFVWIIPLVASYSVHRTYWRRLEMVLSGDSVTNLAFFWIAILIVRGIGYYERFRQTEIAASELRAELVGAQLRALRMQLNPHFLFNTMNGISSLIHDNPDAADSMLEQLSRLLRMTLERGETQEVTLREEIDFVQLYLEIQRTRFGKRLRFDFNVAPSTLDSLIPTMILQPIVENAYRHGISHSLLGGTIRVEAFSKGDELIVSVTNTTDGIAPAVQANADRVPVGTANVKSRLQLHFRERQSFTLRQIDSTTTEARLTIPLKLDHAGGPQILEGFGT